MFDVVAPMFWNIRRTQNTSTIDLDQVKFISIRRREHAVRSYNYLYPLFSHHGVLNAIPEQGLHVREAVLGAWGMTIHANKNYYWHRMRTLDSPFSEYSVAENLYYLRAHYFRQLGLDPAACVTPRDTIVLANRPNTDRGRSLLNADEVLLVFPVCLSVSL